VTVASPAEVQGLLAAGRVVRQALEAMRQKTAPGITTRELDLIAARVLEEGGALPAPPRVYGFPGSVCISINDEIVHGVPSDRVVQEGDLVKLDCVAEKDGFFADAALSVVAGASSEESRKLIECAQRSFELAMPVIRPGARVTQIGRVVENEVRRCGFHVVRQLCGHGVGRSIHEEPSVPNYREEGLTTLLTEGLVITVEPIIAAGTGDALKADDGWTVKTTDGSRSAHFEHTLIVTRNGPLLVTA
jgi:methionyl aminopeptidase